MGEMLKFRLSSTPQQTTIYVPLDTTWAKLKSLAYGFLNVDYGLNMDSIEVIDTNNMNAAIARWNAKNFNFHAIDLMVPGQDLVFIIHVDVPTTDVLPPSPCASHNDVPFFTSSISSHKQELSVLSSLANNSTEASLTSAELEFSSPLMIMNNFDKNAFKKLVCHEVPLDAVFAMQTNSEFLKCCEIGDTTQLNILLKNSLSADVNYAVEGIQGMFLASSLGHLSVMEVLHKEGVGLDEKDPTWHLTPLNVACLKNHEAVAKWLIEKHCCVSKTNIFGSTPLHYICYHAMVSLLPAISKSNSDVVSEGGYSLSHYGSGVGSFPFVENLVMIGADVNCWDNLGNYPLHYAAAAGILESVYLLIEVGKCPVDCLNDNGQTPFLVACRSGHLEIARWLASSKAESSTRGGGGANVFIEDQKYVNALHAATLSGELELISFVCSLGLSVLSRTKEGMLPIQLTTDEKVIELLKKLEAEQWIKEQELEKAKEQQIKTKPVFDELPTPQETTYDNMDVSGTSCSKSPAISNCVKSDLPNGQPTAHKQGKRQNQKQSPGHGQRQPSLLRTSPEENHSHGQIHEYHTSSVPEIAVEKNHDDNIPSPPSSSRNTSLVEKLRSRPAQEVASRDQSVVMHPDPHVDQFFKACLDGNIDVVNGYIAQQHDIFVCNKNGSQAIHFAVRGGHLDIVHLLCQTGADLNVYNDTGVQPMAAACSTLQPNKYAVIKWMITQGVEVFSEKEGTACSNHAMYHISSCAFDCPDLIEFVYKSCPLLKYNVKIMNKSKVLVWSMLHCAAEFGTVANMEALMDIGLRLGPRLQDTLYTPLHCAILRAQPDVELISFITHHCDYDDIRAVDQRGRTAMFHACLIGNFEIVSCLIDADSNNSISIANVAGNTCLHAAYQSGNARLVTWLLDCYPALNVQNNEGAFPEAFADQSATAPLFHKDTDLLYEGFRTGNVDLLKRLNGVHELVEEVLTKDPVGEGDGFFFHTMVARGFLAAVIYLVEGGVPLDVLDENGWTPLHYAVVNGQVDIMHYFVLQHGVNVFDTCGDDGSSCLHLTIKGFEMEYISTVGLLTRINMATELLDLGLDVNCQDLEGNTPAHLAAHCLWLDMILLLQDHGADFYMKNGEMMSVLHQAVAGAETALHNSAALREVEPIIDQLLSFGCDIDIRGRNNLTSFHIACVNGNVELCNALFERGSNIRLSGGKDDLTAVHIAAIKNNLPVVMWLISHGLRHDSINGENKTPADVAYASGNQEIYDWLLLTAPTIYQDRFAECLLEQLFWAIDLEYFSFASIIIEEFLECGPSMDICTEEGSTLMHAAAAVGSLTCLEELFARGLGLEMTASNDNTPLHIACLNDRISCVKSLVALGADVTAADADGNTCLHICVEKENVNIARIFCDIYETVEVQNRNGWTPLHCCCCQGNNAEMLNLLLQKQVNIFKYSFDDETPFYLACKYGHSKFVHDMVVYLLTERILVSEDLLDNAIAMSHESGHSFIAQWLESLQIENGLVQSPLPDASIFLIQLPSEMDDNGDFLNDQILSDMQCTHISASSPSSNLEVFLEAIQSEDFAYVNSLLKSGVSANSVHPVNEMTALHMACLTGNLLLVQVLADYGADLNAQNVGGLTPLHIASDRQYEDIVLFLLEMNASLLKACNNGNTALHMMASRGLCNAIYRAKTFAKQNLCDVGAKNELGQSPLHLAVVSGSMDTCEALLTLGCRIDGSDNEDVTPLLLACSIDLNALVTLLVARGANVNHADSHQRRPLHAACVTGNMLVAHTLIDAGAEVACVTDSGDTLLHVCGKHGQLLLLKWLLKFGLDLCQRNAANKTPRDCAVSNNNDNIVTWIDSHLR